MKIKYTKEQLENKKYKVQKKLNYYRKKLKFSPAILFVILFSFITGLITPIPIGYINAIKAIVCGIGAIATGIYFTRYRNTLEPKYEEYVKFLEQKTIDITKEIEALENENTQNVSSLIEGEIKLPIYKETKIIDKQANQTDNIEETDINSI